VPHACPSAATILHINAPLDKEVRLCLKSLFGSSGEVGKLQADFAKRGVKLLALSCNDVDSHKGYTDLFYGICYFSHSAFHALFLSES